jgi:hypothetical protein
VPVGVDHREEERAPAEDARAEDALAVHELAGRSERVAPHAAGAVVEDGDRGQLELVVGGHLVLGRDALERAIGVEVLLLVEEPGGMRANAAGTIASAATSATVVARAISARSYPCQAVLEPRAASRRRSTSGSSSPRLRFSAWSRAFPFVGGMRRKFAAAPEVSS